MRKWSGSKASRQLNFTARCSMKHFKQ